MINTVGTIQEFVVSQEITADDIKAQIEAQVQSAIEKASSSPEVTEPRDWWEILAFGPIQPGATTTPIGGFTGPLLPHQVIRRGENAFVASLLVLNPFVLPGGVPPTPAQLLNSFALPYTVEFQMANTSSWSSAGTLNAGGNFVPNGPFVYVNVVQLPDQPAGLYEMNVTARILGNAGTTAPPFAGYARQVFDFDSELFQAAPGAQFDLPVRYQVYE